MFSKVDKTTIRTTAVMCAVIGCLLVIAAGYDYNWGQK